MSFVNLATVKQEERRRKWFGESYTAPLPADFDYDNSANRLHEAGHEPPPF